MITMKGHQSLCYIFLHQLIWTGYGVVYVRFHTRWSMELQPRKQIPQAGIALHFIVIESVYPNGHWFFCRNENWKLELEHCNFDLFQNRKEKI